jgi:2-polyprenyl-6-methoxyphenol hydroxylase-like FAD-dependent oxidoreductase
MDEKIPSKKDFKVIIAGGGIAGLTLANCLELAGISYTLLESRPAIAPQIGASVGLLPNGARILDQIGIFDILKTYVDDLTSDTVWIDGGKKKLVTVVAAELIAKRSGYPSIFTQRQIVLKHLFKNLKDQTCVLPGRKVQSVKHTEDGVQVSCANGETYDGDVVVACDGVHSIVREEMRRYAEPKFPDLVKKDRRSSVSYAFNTYTQQLIG